MTARPPAPPGPALVEVACNLCGGRSTRSVHRIPRLVRCRDCGLLYVNPRPALADLVARYGEEYFHCPQPVFGGYEDYEADRPDILRTFRLRLARLRPGLPAARPRVLDVGCATGIFLEAARETGCEAEGIDISPYALARARDKGLRVRHGTLPGLELPRESFDLVTLWDILEHVPDPLGQLRACGELLAPGGRIAISTPDAGSLAARLLRGRWLGFRSLDEHLYFFSRETLGRLLARAGLRVLEVRSTGKYLSLARLIARLRYYTRVGALLLRNVDRFVPGRSLYIDPGDTMLVVARREDGRADGAAAPAQPRPDTAR